MPRTAVAPTSLVPNSSIAQPSATTIDSTLVTNGVSIPIGHSEEIWVEITQTAASAKVITVQSGDPTKGAFEGGLGDHTRSMAQNAVALFGPFTGGRFQQGGAIHIDFESGTTGSMRVYRMPRTA